MSSLIADILFKPMTLLIAVCIALSFLICSTVITKTAANYQTRERCMRLANGLVAYGQKNNGFKNSTIYSGKIGSTTDSTVTFSGNTSERDVSGIINEMVNATALNDKVQIKVYKVDSSYKKIDTECKLYGYGSNNIPTNRLSKDDKFCIEVIPTYQSYNILGFGQTFIGIPIKAYGTAHGYIKSEN